MAKDNKRKDLDLFMLKKIMDDKNVLDLQVPKELVNEAETNSLCSDFVVEMMKNKDVSEESLNKFIETMIDAYSKGYRHSYFSISATIYNCAKENDEYIDNLTQNMEFLKEKALTKAKGKEEATKGFRKFYDHVMLETVRVANNKNIITDAEQLVGNINTRVNENFEKINKQNTESVKAFTEEVAQTKKKMDGVYTEFISILGVFSGIVIVFFGGASVFSGIFSNIQGATWREIGMSCSFVGLALFDIIFMFLYVIAKMIERPIFARTLNEREEKKPYLWRCAIKYPYVIGFNVLMFLAFFISA